MTTVREHLIATRSLIARPQDWIKGSAYERGPDGEPCQFCLYGAAAHAANLTGSKLYTFTVALLRRVAGRDDLSIWQDLPETTHENVLDLIDKAIALSK